MNTSQSFDRAAGIYDQTRPLPEASARQGIQAILEITGPGALILDAGTGTGRISIPLLERGAALVGIDLSRAMLMRLREKSTAASLAQADAALLPFPAHRFDAVLTVHVMHLVGPWRQALDEFRRVLRPGGSYLNIRTYEPVGDSVRVRMREFWRKWILDKGIELRNPGIQDRDELVHALEEAGGKVSENEVVRYTHVYTLRQELERLAARVYSDTWNVQDGIYEASMHSLQAWTVQEYSDLDRTMEDTVRFVMDITTFAS